MIMFKHIDQDIKVASEASSSHRPGQEQTLESMMDCEMEVSHESRVTDILKDEQKAFAVQTYDDITNVDGCLKTQFSFQELLQRQVFIKTITWSQTDLTNSLVGTASLPTELLSNTFIADKVANFYGLHSGMEITVKINPQPFQQGALAVVAEPAVTRNIALADLREYTYYPHQILNMNVMNSVTMQLPYLTNAEGYLLPSATSQGYNIRFVVVSPLRSTASSGSLSVDIFAKLLEPTLMVPVAQAADSDLKETNEEGIIAKISDTISSGLEMASPVLTKIPLIGSFVPPLTWAARCFNKVASYYGWSKPINLKSVMYVTPGGAYRMCNGEGQDNSVCLSVSPDNAVASDLNGVSTIDEMDFNYLLERKFITKLINWTNASVGDFVTIQETGVENPTGFLLNMARLVRYTVNLEFHIVKTRFHTGRVLVQYDPKNNLAYADAEGSMNKVFSKIIDIQTTDHFTFTIPYQQLAPYQFTNGATMGVIRITPFTPLNFPDTVSDSIDFIVYKSFSDVEVGLPYRAVAQGGGECCSNFTPILKDTLIPYEPTMMSKYCVGEQVNNLRLLAKRFTLQYIIDRGNFIITDFYTPAIQNYYPYGPNYTSATLVNGVGSLFQTINQLYAYRSGGIRYKIIFPSNLNMRVRIIPNGATSIRLQNTADQWFFGHLSNVAEVTLPYYQGVKRTQDLYPWPYIHFTIFDENMIETTSTDSVNYKIYVYVAAADDYSGYYPMGKYDVTSKSDNLPPS